VRPACWRLLTRCGVHTMSSALGTSVKLGGAINHLTLVVVSFGRCVVLGARVGCPPWPCGVLLVLFSQWIFHSCSKKKNPV
jgi:hypothetical protein